MSYRTIHLTLSSHPSPISQSAMDYACRAALRFSATLNVTSPHLTVRTPTHALAAGMLAGMAAEFERDAAAKSAELEQYVVQKGTGIGVDVKVTPVSARWPLSSSDLTWRGRTSDLCILSLQQTGMDARLDVEDWIFGVGRPCLLYPNASQHAFSLQSVLITWDFSAAAARAVCDALPILKAAQNVRVLTVRGEKEIAIADVKTPMLDLLAAHGVEAEFIDVDIGKHSIGETILAQAESVHADLLVMGAYGRSRLNEFVLGGATKAVLNSAQIPLLMAH